LNLDNETLLTLEIAAAPWELRTMRLQLDTDLAHLPISRNLREQLILAVNEACMNVIQHAYRNASHGTIRLRLVHETGLLRFLIEDDAPCIDPSRVTPRDLSDVRPGGLGVYFIREIMDEMRFHPCHQRGNRLELVKYLDTD